jgi:hypothetical protein
MHSIEPATTSRLLADFTNRLRKEVNRTIELVHIGASHPPDPVVHPELSTCGGGLHHPSRQIRIVVPFAAGGQSTHRRQW